MVDVNDNVIESGKPSAKTTMYGTCIVEVEESHVEILRLMVEVEEGPGGKRWPIYSRSSM